MQVLRIRGAAGLRFEPAWTGQMFLRRAAYTQLTLGGALPSIDERPVSGRDERGLWIMDEGLETAVGIVVPAPLTIAAGASAVSVVALAFGRAAV